MGWGCISVSSVGDLVKFHGIMNAEKFCQILINHAVEMENVLLATASFFSMTMILHTPCQCIKSILAYSKTQSVMDCLCLNSEVNINNRTQQPTSKVEL